MKRLLALHLDSEQFRLYHKAKCFVSKIHHLLIKIIARWKMFEQNRSPTTGQGKGIGPYNVVGGGPWVSQSIHNFHGWFT